MNDMILPPTFAAPSAKLAQIAAKPEDLGAGIGAAFPVLSYRGKVFRMKHRGQETPLMRADGSGPMSSLEIVIVKASPVISKIYYKGGYKEGDSAPPDCWSVNGVAPDAASPSKQCATCAGCPMNAWGSRISEAGKAGKACADSKRLVITPAGDMRNEAMGGPMLLRVPAASLGGLSTFAQALQSQGYPYYGVVAQISFDIAEAYPLLQFKPVRPLTDAEVDVLVELQNSAQTTRILNEPVDHVVAEVAASVTVTPAAPPAAAPPAAAPPVATPAPVAPVAANPFANAAPVAPAPVALAPVTQAPPPVANPFATQATPAPAAPVAPVAPVQVAQVAQVAQPVQQPVQAEVDPMVRLPGESVEEQLVRVQEYLKSQQKTRGRKPKTSAPSPNPTPPEAASVATVATPTTVPAVAPAPVQPVLDAGNIQQLDALLDNLV